MAYDVPRTTATAVAYLRSGADRQAYKATVAIAACKFQDDPHNQKITHSRFEEYRTTRRTGGIGSSSPPCGCSRAGRRCRASATATPGS